MDSVHLQPVASVRLSASVSKPILSKPLWDILVDSASSSSSLSLSSIPISIASRSNPTRSLLTTYVEPLACASSNITSHSSSHKDVIYIPRTWARSYNLRHGLPVILSNTQPAFLSRLVILSLSRQAYSLARDLLQPYVCNSQHIIRQGSTLTIDAPEHCGKLSYQVLACEPVLQGVCTSDHTNFVVLAPRQALDNDDPSVDNGSSSSRKELERSNSVDMDLLDIEETFLAPSLAPVHDFVWDDAPTDTHSQSRIPGASPQYPLYHLDYLRNPIPDDDILPKPPLDEDVQLRAFLTPADLARHGICSGDWIMLVREPDKRPLRRILRLYALPDSYATPGSSSSSRNQPSLYVSPTTLHNLNHASSLVFIHVLRTAPKLPVASSLNLARVASPHSLQKQYQPLFLASLRTYFQRYQCSACLGDIMSLPIDETLARWSHDESDSIVHLPGSSTGPNANVFFKITSLKISPANLDNGANLDDEASDDDDDEIREHIRNGYFGAIVDPTITKLLQAGVEHGRPPTGSLSYTTSDASSAALKTPSGIENSETYQTFLQYLTAPLSPTAAPALKNMYLSMLIKGAKGSGKSTLVMSAASAASVHLFEVDAFSLISDTDVKTEGQLRATFDKAISCTPCVLLLRNIEALARQSQVVENGQEPALTFAFQDCLNLARDAFAKDDTDGGGDAGFPCYVIGTTSDAEKMSTGILSAFKQEITLEAPNETERLNVLTSLSRNDTLAPDVSLRSIAIQTAALVASDLVDLLSRARINALDRAITACKIDLPDSDNSKKELPNIQDLYRAGMAIESGDLNEALDKARVNYSESIGAPKIPNVTWDDVGGLASVKTDILDTIQLPLEQPELFAEGLKKRSGILLYGPPGTGKTLLAKAVATSCSLNFFSIKGPELLNMYIGESEANVRKVFQRARDAKPCVIFFDELDSVAPKRGNQGDSGGVMDRIVSQLLAELDGMAEGKAGADVFVIGATNRPDLLDPALLRPGRFDRMLYLGVSDTHESQYRILEALTRKFKCDPASVDLREIAEMCPFNFTGADFYALCSDALLKAMTRTASEVDVKVAEYNKKNNLLQLSSQESSQQNKLTKPITAQYYLSEIAKPFEIQVLVKQEDFIKALQELEPSVSKAEMEHYKIVQKRFGDGSGSNNKENDHESSSNGGPMENNKIVDGLAQKVIEKVKDDKGKKTSKLNGEDGDFINDNAINGIVDGIDEMDYDNHEGFKKKVDKGKGRAL